MSTVVLLAGPSGSGKTRLARLSGATVFRLDDFYADADDSLPHVHGYIDWDDVATWHMDDAIAALRTLVGTGTVEVPTYDISQSRTIGTHAVTHDASRPLIAEGIFSVDLVEPARAAGLDVLPIWLDRPRAVTFSLRLRRDLAQHRKSVPVLLRRGIALSHAEPALRRRALQAGFQPLSMRRALARLTA